MAIYALFLITLMLIPNFAFAYLDPGSGSMILQIIVGGIAGIAVAIKLGWRHIWSFFHNLGCKCKGENADTTK